MYDIYDDVTAGDCLISVLLTNYRFLAGSRSINFHILERNFTDSCFTCTLIEP